MPHSHTDEAFLLLTAAQLVCNNCLVANGDESLTRVIDTFLDTVSRSLSLSAAYKIGSLRLLQYVACREPSSVDLCLRRWEFNNVTGQVAACGDLETLKWLIESYYPDEFLTEVVTQASDNGHLHILTWLWENHRNRGYWGGAELCHAMENKHYEVVQWLRSHVAIQYENAQSLIRLAAADGDIKLVQFLRENFDVEIIPALHTAVCNHQYDAVLWILNTYKCADLAADSMYSTAAAIGDLDMVKIMFEHGSVEHKEALFKAASHGHLHIVKWLHEEKGVSLDGEWLETTMSDSYVKIPMDVIKYFHQSTANFVPRCAMDAAVESGRVEFAEWVWVNSNARIPCSQQAIDLAARRGSLEMVQWLHEHYSRKLGSGTMHYAAENGHLEVVKWLHQNRSEGCRDATMARAALQGNLEIVKWLHSNRNEHFNLDGVMDAIAANGYLDVLQWFHEHRDKGCSIAAMDKAAACGHLDVVKWLHEHRKEGCSHRAMDGAAMNGHLKVVKWLHLNRFEGCSTRAIDTAAGNNHLKVVKWLHVNRSQRCTPLALEWLFSRSDNVLDTAAFVLSEFPECRAFRLRGTFRVARLEIVEWLLVHAPTALEECCLEVSSWNWYICDWLRRHHWLVCIQEYTGKAVTVFTKKSSIEM
ncbi:hypothetical protein PHMEG_00031794 [Phytophthora megakarya]|uniref:Uncharacterized protein n=1 Tax=Phytophthora megakarya TaxID=4795 RepID=A0A225UWV2_9STRA|nr:hypothetical protein PHMEG_00031794 [Phytophthora megakarya]